MGHGFSRGGRESGIQSSPPLLLRLGTQMDIIRCYILFLRCTTTIEHVLIERLFLAEDVVVVLGEAVGFVAHLLQQSKGGVVAGQAYRGCLGLDV